jgi:hypothetical protein
MLSTGMLSNPASALAAYYNGTKSLPVKHLVKGRVILAGKHDGKWGGMIISKK